MKTTQAIADETGESTRTIQRYKKLLELSEPLVKMVDNGRISLRAAGVLADLNVNTQNRLAEDLRDNEQQVMTIELAKALVEREKDGQEISLSAQQVARMFCVLKKPKRRQTHQNRKQEDSNWKLNCLLISCRRVLQRKKRLSGSRKRSDNSMNIQVRPLVAPDLFRVNGGPV